MREPETSVFTTVTQPSQINSHSFIISKSVAKVFIFSKGNPGAVISKHNLKPLKLLLHLPFFYFLDSFSILLTEDLQRYFYSLSLSSLQFHIHYIYYDYHQRHLQSLTLN